MNKAIKYRLYPTTEQAILFIKTFGCCRKVYNLMLNDKLESYKATGNCGITIGRDQNAAINIKNEGLRILKCA